MRPSLPVYPPPPAPEPPLPPQPASFCSPGPYIVFFGFGKADITPESAAILDNALVQYQDCGDAKILLAGYTDTAGAVTANLGLAARRNGAVLAYLSAHGAPGRMISSKAFGEQDQRVATADGVQERQNNRVEITFEFGASTTAAPSPDLHGAAVGPYTTILVLGANTSQFRYIRQDLFNTLPTSTQANADVKFALRLAHVLSDTLNFAPQPSGSRYSVRNGSTYLFIPECPVPVSKKDIVAARGGDPKVTVKCP